MGQKDPGIPGWYSKEFDLITTFSGNTKRKSVNKSLKILSNAHYLLRTRHTGWKDSPMKSQYGTLESRSHDLLPSGILQSLRQGGKGTYKK